MRQPHPEVRDHRRDEREIERLRCDPQSFHFVGHVHGRAGSGVSGVRATAHLHAFDERHFAHRRRHIRSEPCPPPRLHLLDLCGLGAQDLGSYRLDLGTLGTLRRPRRSAAGLGVTGVLTKVTHPPREGVADASQLAV